jgi:flagellin-like protein
MTGRRSSRAGERTASATGTRGRRTRGQSEVLGVVLLLGITIMGTGLIVAFGSSALDDSKQNSEIDSAEHAMTQLDSKASIVGVGESRAQSVSLGVDGTTRVANRSGWMRVQVINDTDDTVEYVVMNQSLGAVTYQNGNTRVAYQGGGVWESTDGEATMVSPPEFHYRGTTLTLPLVVVSGQGPLTGTTVVRQNGTIEPKYPKASSDRRNPLNEAKVNVTVHSDYYRAWGRFFEQRAGGGVVYDQQNQSVTLTLVTPIDRPPISGGIVSTASGDKLDLDNKAYVDSYNSSEDVYADSGGENGTVVTAGSVELDNKAKIKSDLVSGGGKVSLENPHTEITGNLSYKSLGDMDGTVQGWKANNGSAPSVGAVGGLIDKKVDAIESNNDNDETGGDITSDDYLNSSRSTYELDEGRYYLKKIDLNDKTIELDTTNGDIEIAVENGVTLDDADIDVQGSGTVRVYMDGQALSLNNHASVSVPNQESPRFWLYGPPGTDVDIDNHVNFTGVIYAPDSPSKSGNINVDTQSEVYGALVGTVTDIDNTAGVHFDEALLSVTDVTGGDNSVPRVTYLHVSVSRVNVTST